MNPQQLQQVNQRLNVWRESHPDPESRREAYRRKVMDFTLSSMALEQEPVERSRMLSLMNRPVHEMPPANS